jgi:hypothetical protein
MRAQERRQIEKKISGSHFDLTSQMSSIKNRQLIHAYSISIDFLHNITFIQMYEVHSKSLVLSYRLLYFLYFLNTHFFHLSSTFECLQRRIQSIDSTFSLTVILQRTKKKILLFCFIELFDTATVEREREKENFIFLIIHC